MTTSQGHANLDNDLRNLSFTVSRMQGLYACIIDRDERIVALNREMADFWNVDTQEAPGRSVIDFLQLGRKAPLLKAARSRKASHGVIPVTRRGETNPIFVYVAATPINIGGQYVGVINIGMPITEEVRAQSLKEGLYVHPELLVIILSQDGRITELNDEAAAMLGLTGPGEAKGRPLAEFFPDDYEAQPLATLADGKVRHRYVLCPLPTGPRHLDIFSTPLYDQAGTVIGALVIARDATEEVRVKQQLERAWQLHVVGELASKTTHELRNCLAAIRCTAQLGEIDSDDVTARGIFTRIKAQVDSTNRLLSQLLDLSRPTQRIFRPVHLPDVVEDIASVMRSQLLQHGVTLTLRAPADLPTVSGDPQLLHQALLNLLNNSLDSVPKPGGHVEITLARARNGVEILVADNGPGLPESILPHLFEPFFTTKEHGFGLGLSIVHQIVVEAHGGSIGLDNQPGRGAAFRITLPALKAGRPSP